jgi:hypothetical protein
MQSVTSVVYSTTQKLVICLSSCSEVFLIDSATSTLVHQYPASLMTCGAALSTMAGVEVAAVPGSTFLVLGGIDGSFCVRELNKRDRDGKLQCVLHRCIDRLAPQPKAADQEISLDPADGCPLSSLFVVPELDVCVAGDASCAVYIVGLKLVPMTPAPTPGIEDEDARRGSFDQETVLEPSVAGGDDSELVPVEPEDLPPFSEDASAESTQPGIALTSQDESLDLQATTIQEIDAELAEVPAEQIDQTQDDAQQSTEDRDEPKEVPVVQDAVDDDANEATEGKQPGPAGGKNRRRRRNPRRA